jgi:hypothetical protein
MKRKGPGRGTGRLGLDGIHHLRRRDTLGYHGQCLTFDGGPDAVEDETRAAQRKASGHCRGGRRSAAEPQWGRL